jgi:uncharacterized protein
MGASGTSDNGGGTLDPGGMDPGGGTLDPAGGTLAELGPAELAEVMRRFSDALAEQRDLLDRLNVYPVPDGDTGSNLSLTLASVCAELPGPPGTGMAVVCEAIVRGSLMGARGNSGVIVAQILRGFSNVAGTAGRLDALRLGEALRAAASAAYEAVAHPVEGTILTVARRAAEAAETAAAAGADLAGVAQAARDAAAEAVARTPEQLPVLAAAGVVDAGGAGLSLLFDAAASVVQRLPAGTWPGGNWAMGMAAVAEASAVEAAAGGAAARGSGDDGATSRGASAADNPAAAAARALATADAGAGAVLARGPAQAIGPRFEVMFLLSTDARDDVAGGSVAGGNDAGGNDAGVADRVERGGPIDDGGASAVDRLRRAWDGLGESIVVVGGNGLWNCHVHTDNIGAVLEVALEAGRPRAIRVTDLAEQVAHRHGAGTGERTAVVAVAQGHGLVAAFAEMGARVVHGGQGANPSTAELVDAIEACGTPEVVVLPDNANVVAVAEQAARVASARVHVVPTRSVIAGLAALSGHDPVAEGGDNAEAMAWACQDVVAVEVTRAVRDGTCAAGAVSTGDWMVLVDGEAVTAGSDGVVAVRDALQRALRPGHELVTLFEGDGAEKDLTDAVVSWLGEVHPAVEVEVHHGGQPLYPYLIGIE